MGKASSERQRKAAIQELINRAIHKQRKQRTNEKEKRPFGTATKEQVAEFIRLKDE